MKKEHEEKLLNDITSEAVAPMDAMIKKQQHLTKNMLAYSFELGRILGYMAGYSEAKENIPYRTECTPNALSEFLKRKIQ